MVISMYNNTIILFFTISLEDKIGRFITNETLGNFSWHYGLKVAKPGRLYANGR